MFYSSFRYWVALILVFLFLSCNPTLSSFEPLVSISISLFFIAQPYPHLLVHYEKIPFADFIAFIGVVSSTTASFLTDFIWTLVLIIALHHFTYSIHSHKLFFIELWELNFPLHSLLPFLLDPSVPCLQALVSIFWFLRCTILEGHLLDLSWFLACFGWTSLDLHIWEYSEFHHSCNWLEILLQSLWF